MASDVPATTATLPGFPRPFDRSGCLPKVLPPVLFPLVASPLDSLSPFFWGPLVVFDAWVPSLVSASGVSLNASDNFCLTV